MSVLIAIRLCVGRMCQIIKKQKSTLQESKLLFLSKWKRFLSKDTNEVEH